MTAHEVLLQQLINGFTTGSYLALIALGYTMVYGIIELINFAHGDIYALGFFISLSLLTWLGITSTLTGGQLLWTIPGVMLLTMLATGLANMSVDRIAYRPLRHAPRLAPLITAIGASFALENIMQNWYGPGQIYYYNIFPTINLAPALLGPQSEVLFATKDVFLVAVTIPLMVGLTLFVKHTKMGKAMRATAQDREAAAVVGGIGNIPGAVLGGYLIGCLSALSDQYLSAAWTRATVFALLILFLVFRPSGILGEQIPEKF